MALHAKNDRKKGNLFPRLEKGGFTTSAGYSAAL